MRKLILTDIDDTFLNYSDPFLKFLKLPLPEDGERIDRYHKYVQRYLPDITPEELNQKVFQFNTSEEFSKLEPFKNSLEHIERLYNDGYEFLAISSCGENPQTKSLRDKNIVDVFGENIFKDVILLPQEARKLSVLKDYEDSGLIWLEDNVKNYNDGYNLGLRSALVVTPYNDHDHDHIDEHDHWETIENLVRNYYE